MKHPLKDPRLRAYVAIGVLALVVVAVLWPLAVGRDARHLTAYRDHDEDLSAFHGEIVLSAGRVSALLSTPHLLRDVEDPRGTLLIVIGPERRYDASEAEAILAFVKAGGTLLLADETGYGSDIASAAGFAFASQSVLDTQNYRGDPALVVARTTVGPTAYRVLYNAPSTIVPLRDARPHDVLAETSASAYPDGSYLDTNENDEIDLADQPGPFPLAVRTTLGDGTLVLVADTGLFMNAQMLVPDAENARFVRALVASLLPQGGEVILDESRHAPTFGVAWWENSVRTLGRVTSGPVASLVLLGVLSLASLAAWRFTRETEDWSHHEHSLGDVSPLPANVRPDAARLQRMARSRISERYNIPLEQVSAMTTEELRSLTSDRALAEAATGAYKGDPAPLFRSFSSSTQPTPEATP